METTTAKHPEPVEPQVQLKPRVSLAALKSLSAHGAEFFPLNIEQYHKTIPAGIIEECAPIELLDGLLVWKNRAATGGKPLSVSPLHSTTICKLFYLGPMVEAYNCFFMAQNPITLPPYNEPEPDGTIVRGTIKDYVTAPPGPGDVFCVIEVADSSLDFDRTEKQRIYANAGIPQYLIINLIEKRIEVHEQPLAGLGRYGQVKIVKHGEKVALLVGAEQRLEVAANELLP